MKTTFAIVALACLAGCAPALAQDLNVREFRRVVDARQVTIADRLPWYAGESVGYTVLSRRDRSAVQIPDGSVPVWVVMASTSAIPRIVSTGSVVSATNGEVRFWLPAPQANLPAGDYLSYATVYQGTNRVGVLDRSTVRVSWRPGDDFEAAAPITNVWDVVAGWLADARADLAAASNSMAEAIAAETSAREEAGYLTAEADAAGLEAAAGVQGNLTTHAGSTNNPHAVTAAQLGALTAEVDPGFSSWEPTAHVPVVCAGGWLYPDYFSMSTYPYAETGISYGLTSKYNSVLFTWQSLSPQKGVVLAPEIVHQADWTSVVAYADAEGLDIVSGDGGISYANWLDGTASGAVGRVTAVLGGFSRSVELTYPGAGTAKSNAWWVADLPGSLRAAVNDVVSNLAWASGVEAPLYLPGAYSTTNFVRNSACWAASLDLTCASPWNSYRYLYVSNGTTYTHNVYGNYHAGTSITPQHFLYAAHWATPTNTVFRWIDATNGVHNRTLVAQRFLGNDIALGLLDSPLPASIAPAKALAESDIGCLRGKFNLRNAPGLRVVYLDGIEIAWQAATTMMENAADNTLTESFFVAGSTNLPFSRLGAVGGDSGNPIFLTEGTNVMLLSTFWTPNGGPMLTAFRSEIDGAMVEMGGSIYTNWPTADLSSWTNYDAGADLPDY